MEQQGQEQEQAETRRLAIVGFSEGTESKIRPLQHSLAKLRELMGIPQPQPMEEVIKTQEEQQKAAVDSFIEKHPLPQKENDDLSYEEYLKFFEK
jgi:hypothetical protein